MKIYEGSGERASLSTVKENLNMAFIRSNRVKSELITHKSLLEENFSTKNYATHFNNIEDIVTFRIPIIEEISTPEPEPEEPILIMVEEPEPLVEPITNPTPILIEAERMMKSKPYHFAIRTNLLYDAFLQPILGIEWRMSQQVGIKLDGSYSHGGGEHGRVQKIWLINPEIRWYMLTNKNLYLGLGANFGEANIYKGLARILSKESGYQGDIYGGGITIGFNLSLNKYLAMDFNLGLGYSRFNYDTFNIENRNRVYKERDLHKNFWGPTQAGVNLIWKIGGNNNER